METINKEVIKDYYNIIGGEKTKTVNKEMLNSVDPSTGLTWARIPRSQKEDVSIAIESSRAAFKDWSALPARVRGDYLRKIGDMISDYSSELLTLETRNNGWILDEYAYLDQVLKQIWYDAAGAAAILGGQGRTIQMGGDNFGFTLRKPYGVVVGILPWNAPLFTFTIKAAYALAAGNTMIVKPSEHASVATLRYGELIANILPKGTLNVLSGLGSEIGDYLVGHKDVDKVSMTGSIRTAEAITKASAPSPKSMIFELGGKSPNIIFDDADLDKAIPGVLNSIFTRNSGQICVASSRILIQRTIYNKVLEKMKEIMTEKDRVKYGDILDITNTTGPIANAPQYEKVCSYIDIAKEEGEIIIGGEYGGDVLLPDEPAYKDGFWVEPTLVKVENNKHRICQEEVFGPIAAAIPFDTEDEAIEIANDTSYGLAAGVWTTDLGKANRMVDKIEAGNVWVNTYAMVGVDLPFGGVKESGYGTDSILEYTYEKACVMNITK